MRGSSAWLEGERVLLVDDALFELGPHGWIVRQTAPGMFDILRGEGWTALPVHGAAGESDWMLYQRDGEDEWRRVEAPEGLLERRWHSVTRSKTHVYVRNEGGLIARFDGTEWEEVAVGEWTDRVGIAVVGDVIYDWHGEMDVFEDGAFHRLPEQYVAAPWGDGEQAFLRLDARTLVRVTPDGSETLPPVPSNTDVVRARGDHIAIQTRGNDTDVYRLVAGEWQLVATDQMLLAVDEDGTLLLGQEGTASMLAPDGSTRVLGADTEPVGPLLGESRAALWTRASRGGLLRFAEDHWEPVTETEELGIVSAWRSPSGSLFLATAADVYRLTDAGLEALPAPGSGDTRKIIGRSDEELYRDSLDTDAMRRVQRWDGTTWTELEELARPTSERPNDLLEYTGTSTPTLIGPDGFLIVRWQISAPDEDPVGSAVGLASTGGEWQRVLGYIEFDASNLRAAQLGDPASPIGLFLSEQPPYPAPLRERKLHYDRLDPEDPTQVVESGSLEYNFGSIDGDDLEHLVGVVDDKGVSRFMLRDGSEWRAIGEGALHFGAGGAAWYGSDAVGVADTDGVTICSR